MNRPAELAAERTILEHYIFDAPDARTAIADEKWLARQDIGWLQTFQCAVQCLDTVLRRVLDDRMRR